MLETIREYAEERLEESGAAPELYGRFFHWALALAEEVEFGSRQHQWLQRVQAEHENVRAALRVAPSPEDGLRLASSLGEFWIWGGHIREGRLLVDALLEAAPEARADVRAKGSLVAGELAIYQDDYASAAESLDQAEQLFAQLGDEASSRSRWARPRLDGVPHRGSRCIPRTTRGGGRGPSTRTGATCTPARCGCWPSSNAAVEMTNQRRALKNAASLSIASWARS